MNPFPKISIVTPSFNQGKFLEKTILSVLEQDYPNLEYIVIDGGSTDNSVEIIKKYEQHLTYWVSEPDRGQSHAINKGFERATGEIFGWLNSDDWYHPGALKAVAEAFAANPDAGAVVGAGDMVDADGNQMYMFPPFDVNLTSLFHWIDRFFMQPSCFFRSNTWNVCGQLTEHIHFAMDLDYWIRIAKKYSFSTCEEILSSSLVHPSAKTTEFAAKSIVDAMLVIYENGGKDTCRLKMEEYVVGERLSVQLLAKLGECERGLTELEKQISERDQYISNICDSYSWKLTAPIRKVASLFTGNKNN